MDHDSRGGEEKIEVHGDTAAASAHTMVSPYKPMGLTFSREIEQCSKNLDDLRWIQTQLGQEFQEKLVLFTGFCHLAIRRHNILSK